MKLFEKASTNLSSLFIWSPNPTVFIMVSFNRTLLSWISYVSALSLTFGLKCVDTRSSKLELNKLSIKVDFPIPVSPEIGEVKMNSPSQISEKISQINEKNYSVLKQIHFSHLKIQDVNCNVIHVAPIQYPQGKHSWLTVDPSDTYLKPQPGGHLQPSGANHLPHGNPLSLIYLWPIENCWN